MKLRRLFCAAAVALPLGGAVAGTGVAKYAGEFISLGARWGAPLSPWRTT